MMDEIVESSMHPREEPTNPFQPARPFTAFRRLFCEGFGTFLLVSVDCGAAMTAQLSHGEVTPVARSFATGLIVMAMSSAMADVSGAHFNPAITLAFAMRRAFPWRTVPAYWAAQLLGAVLASVALRCVLGDVEHLGAALPKLGVGHAFAAELLITTILVVITLGTATRHRVLGPQAAIAAGGTIASCALFARPISGASMNPARSIGPALISGATGSLGVYLVAQLAAAALGYAIVHVIHLRFHPEEREAARGEPK
jgi:MIP family channel proteins